MISIIIATFNSDKTLRQCLDSVKKQSFSNWECIIVDGLSKDNTINVLKEYISIDHRFRFISEKDYGIFDALNKGVKLAKGEWVYVLGSDDILTTNGLNDLYNETKDYDIVYGNTIDIYPNGVIRKPHSKDYHLVRKNMFCSHQAIIMRKEIIEKLGYFSLKYPLKADFDLIQKAFLKGYKFHQIETEVAYFSMDGVSGKASSLQEFERYKILKANKSTRFPLMTVLFLFVKKNLKKIYLSVYTKFKQR